MGSLECLAQAFYTPAIDATSNHMYMLRFIVILIASFRPIWANGCTLCVSRVCIVSRGPCLPKLLAWQLEAVSMKMMSVQVCSESAGHAEAIEKKSLSAV